MDEDLHMGHASAVEFKRKASWDGIRLEHYKFRAGELPSHSHTEHIVIISLSDGCKGELTTASGLGIRGKQTKGSVCVLPSNLKHQAKLEGPSEHLVLYLEPSLITRAASESRLSGGFEIVERYARADKIISSIGLTLLDELNSEGLSGRLYAESLANVLAVHLLRYYTDSTSVASPFNGGLSPARLRQVTDYIAANYARDLKLAELAQVAGMSSFHFVREFKRTTGTTPHQYLIKFRVQQAKQLLARHDLPLIEVGLRTGFSHQSHFTRLFRRLTGTTPHSYRLSMTPQT